MTNPFLAAERRDGQTLHFDPDVGPSGGWGSVRSLGRYSVEEREFTVGKDMLTKQNKPGGFMCVSCAWAKPARPHLAEFCENGGKATLWELTPKRVTPAFFAEHTVSELLTWSDHALEAEGRLTDPMRYDRASDCYVPVGWDEAMAGIGASLRALDPKSVIFYASGRASLETTYMYQLFARLYGNNNLPDSSNMCHETTSVALPPSIGVPVGTVLLEDFETADLILSFGQNVGSNAPRMLHQLQDLRERGGEILVFNPLHEMGWQEFVDPQSPLQMATNRPTTIATGYYTVRAAGDIAAMMGICKALIAWHDEGREGVIDTGFIAEHTHGFDRFAAVARNHSWEELEHAAGLSRGDMEEAAGTYARARAAIAVYGMGLTQHRYGVDTVQMLVNLLLLRGNIGKAGAGICPVRGHSNVQGQRTVGMTEKVELAPLDKLAAQYGFEPPRENGRNTVEACEGMLDGSVRGFIGLGGNFLRAIPDHNRMEPAWRRLALSVQIATKLNHTHLAVAEETYLLPCLGRIEVDRQATGEQVVSIEDSTARIHASRGFARPAGENLWSEPRIVAEMAKATLPENPNVPWDAWVADYGRVRAAIEETYSSALHGFSEKMREPGGFTRGLPARERQWKTPTGRANFMVPRALHAGFDDGSDPSILRLMTLRSNDQFNTTVYGYDDRFRGVSGSRMVVLANAADLDRFGIPDRAPVKLTTAVEDGTERVVDGLTAIAYDIPEGCVGAYFPECNALIPLWQYAEDSKTPAAKSVPVRIAAA